MLFQQENGKQAAIRASNLNELEVTPGRLPEAMGDARHSITHADQSGEAFERMAVRCEPAGSKMRATTRPRIFAPDRLRGRSRP